VVLASNKYRKGCTRLDTNHPTSFPLESLIGFPTYLYQLDSLYRIWLKKYALKQLGGTLTVVLE